MKNWDIKDEPKCFTMSEVVCGNVRMGGLAGVIPTIDFRSITAETRIAERGCPSTMVANLRHE